jgi:hypothetical protein
MIALFTITAYTVELIKDPFGILSGTRYEFILEIEVPEEDELYSDQGVLLRVIYTEDEARSGITKYEFLERNTNKYLDFELESEEEKFVEAFCKVRLSEADAE